MLCTETCGYVKIYLHAEFHIPGCSGSLVITIRWKATFCKEMTKVAHILKICYHIGFHEHALSGPSC